LFQQLVGVLQRVLRVYLGSAGCVDPPVVTLDFTEIVCFNDGLITLTQGTPEGGTYTGTGITGTTQFDASAAGIGTHTITYTYIAPGGCSAIASDAITVAENPPANTTLGSASLNLCESDPVVLVANAGTGLSYQWYKNAVALPGEIYLAYLAYTTGNYQVEVTNASGCSKMSKKKKVTHSGCRLEGETTENNFLMHSILRIYPNPNNGQFNFQFISGELTEGDVHVQILDISGRTLNEFIFNASDGMVGENMSVQLPSGIYVIRLIQNGIYQTTSFVVN